MDIPPLPPAGSPLPLDPVQGGAGPEMGGSGGHPDLAAPLRILIAEIRDAAVTALGEPAVTLSPPLAVEAPLDTAIALTNWLSTAAAASGRAPDVITSILEQGYVRAMAGVVPGAPGADAMHAVYEAAAARLAAPPSATVLHAPDPAAGLRVFADEVRAQVTADLDVPVPPVPPAPPALAGEPGNVAAQLLTWLRGVADSAGIAPGELRPSVERGAQQATAALELAHAEAPTQAAVGRAHDVVLAGLALPSGVATPVPLFRPDVVQPVPLPGQRRPRVPRRPPDLPSEPTEPSEADEEGVARVEAPDLKGPMDLIRRYFEDLQSHRPAFAARFFVLPAGFWIHGRWTGYADATRLGEYFAAVKADLEVAGVRGGRLLMLRAEPIAPLVALVHALTTRESAAGEVIEEFEMIYTTVRTPGGWRIATVIRR